MTGNDAQRPAEPPKVSASEERPSAVDTRTLFGTRREVVLVHRGEPYRLRQTQSGKLILTK